MEIWPGVPRGLRNIYYFPLSVLSFRWSWVVDYLRDMYAMYSVKNVVLVSKRRGVRFAFRAI